MGLHICNISLRGTDARGEWVQVANDGVHPVPLTGKELTDETGTQQRPHRYRFPSARGGVALMLRPRQSAFVFTGKGTDVVSNQGDYLLYANRGAPVWNNTGDVAYLRNADGTFIDTMTVGDRPRHPNGH